jgi:hypothetical protein
MICPVLANPAPARAPAPPCHIEVRSGRNRETDARRYISEINGKHDHIAVIALRVDKTLGKGRFMYRRCSTASFSPFPACDPA